MVRGSISAVLSHLIVGTGNLALARALGDFDYKKNSSLSPEAQIITCDPELIEHDITEEDEFLIIACDGASLRICSTRSTRSLMRTRRYLGLPVLAASCQCRQITDLSRQASATSLRGDL